MTDGLGTLKLSLSSLLLASSTLSCYPVLLSTVNSNHVIIARNKAIVALLTLECVDSNCLIFKVYFHIVGVGSCNVCYARHVMVDVAYTLG